MSPGFCADEQGLGKTIQLLALVCSSPPSARNAEIALAHAVKEGRNLRDALANQRSLAEVVSRGRDDVGTPVLQSRPVKPGAP